MSEKSSSLLKTQNPEYRTSRWQWLQWGRASSPSSWSQELGIWPPGLASSSRSSRCCNLPNPPPKKGPLQAVQQKLCFQQQPFLWPCSWRRHCTASEDSARALLAGWGESSASAHRLVGGFSPPRSSCQPTQLPKLLSLFPPRPCSISKQTGA